MKIFLLKLFKTITLQIIAIIILIGTVTFAAISWPTNVPVGEIAGGKIIEYFTNMGGDCPDGEVVKGFNKDFSKNCGDISISTTISTSTSSSTDISAKTSTKKECDIEDFTLVEQSLGAVQNYYLQGCTGLMWETEESSTKKQWATSNFYSEPKWNGSNYFYSSGRTGSDYPAFDYCDKKGSSWRLPTKDELSSIISKTQNSNNMYSKLESIGKSNYYWSSNIDTEDVGAGLFGLFSFNNSAKISSGNRTSSLGVICVNDGDNNVDFSYKQPKDFKFFKVNNNEKDEVGSRFPRMLNADQSCIWKVYFQETNSNMIPYDVILDGKKIFSIVSSNSDSCTNIGKDNSLCSKTINMCKGNNIYDNQFKKAYIVQKGTTDITGAPSSSFKNSCTPTTGTTKTDGMDNDCDGIFDEKVCDTCEVCKSCSFDECQYKNIPVGPWKSSSIFKYTFLDSTSCEWYKDGKVTKKEYEPICENFETKEECEECGDNAYDGVCHKITDTNKSWTISGMYMGCSSEKYKKQIDQNTCEKVTKRNCNECGGTEKVECECKYY